MARLGMAVGVGRGLALHDVESRLWRRKLRYGVARCGGQGGVGLDTACCGGYDTVRHVLSGKGGLGSEWCDWEWHCVAVKAGNGSDGCVRDWRLWHVLFRHCVVRFGEAVEVWPVKVGRGDAVAFRWRLACWGRLS